MKCLLKVILKLLFRTKIIGLEQLRFDGATIIMPNHISFLDAIFLYAYLPSDVYYVVNTAIAAKIAFFLKLVNYVTIDPLNPYSVKKLIKVVREGKPLVIFPEGRISTTGSLMKIYGGVSFIAYRTGAKIYPVILQGLQYTKFTRIKGKVKSRWFPQTTVFIDQPFTLEVATDKSAKLQKKESSDKILAILQNSMFKAKQSSSKNINLFNELLLSVGLHGAGKVIAEDVNGTVTYKKLLLGSYILGKRLDDVLSDEETAAVLLPNAIGHLVTLFALFYIDKTPAILNFSAGTQNNTDCAHTAGIKTVLTSRAFVEKAGFEEYIGRLSEHFRILYLEDIKCCISLTDRAMGLWRYCCKEKALLKNDKNRPPCVILFTSGSESKPKGVVLSHANIRANINQVSCVIDYTPKDKMLNALPMFHSFGLTAGTILPVLEGIEVFLYPSPLHYRVIPEVSYDRNITLLLGTPTFLMGYGKNAHPYDFCSIRYVLAGGEKLKNEVRMLWQEKFGIRIFEGYGTTEAAPIISINTPLFNRTGSVGKFLPGIEWKTEAVEGVTEGGNLHIKGANIMQGYLIYGRGFVAQGEWYNCGDVVYVDDEGFINIKSRLKRFAKVSGEMISLDAVEKAAENCFGSEKNAAINIADGKKGEKVILYTSDKAANKQMLREYIKNNGMSMLMMPVSLVVLDKLPLLGSGKTDYVTLKEIAEKDGDSYVYNEV